DLTDDQKHGESDDQKVDDSGEEHAVVQGRRTGCLRLRQRFIMTGRQSNEVARDVVLADEDTDRRHQDIVDERVEDLRERGDDDLVDVGGNMSEEKAHRQKRGSDGEYEGCSEDNENHGSVHDFSLVTRGWRCVLCNSRQARDFSCGCGYGYVVLPAWSSGYRFSAAILQALRRGAADTKRVLTRQLRGRLPALRSVRAGHAGTDGPF